MGFSYVISSKSAGLLHPPVFRGRKQLLLYPVVNNFILVLEFSTQFLHTYRWLRVTGVSLAVIGSAVG